MSKQQRGLGRGIGALLGDVGDLESLRSPVILQALKRRSPLII